MKSTFATRMILFISLLFSTSCTSPESAPGGTINGYVMLPGEIPLSTTAKEANVYIYLRDYTPQNGKKVLPWDAPIKKILSFEIRSLNNHKVAFECQNLPEGTYGISVLVDTGRPHVPPGSSNFTAFPGDYTGGTRDDIELKDDQTVQISIDEGLYVPIPDGYEAPVYAP